MNRVMFIGSLIGVWLFLMVLGFTFFAQGWIKEFARDYINQRIEPSMTRAVNTLEEKILPLAQKESPELALKIITEITEYRQDPLLYIADTTAGRRIVPEKKDGRLDKLNTWSKSLSASGHSIREIIRDHFQQVFSQLILDLQIFSLSNIIGYGVVVWLTNGQTTSSPRLQVQAFILFIATCYALSVYIKQDWFFNLLLDLHMGLFYPLLIFITCVDLWRRWQQVKLRKSSQAVVSEILTG
jgi:hypothetical protein